MGFGDDLKRSLGFEDNSANKSKNLKKSSKIPTISKIQHSMKSDLGNNEHNNVYSDDVSIVPEQFFYEIMLIRPRTVDDINYVVDQVVGENNPVILDLSFLERESSANFKFAGEKIKQMRKDYGAQALLLSRCENKHLIIITPNRINVVKK